MPLLEVLGLGKDFGAEPIIDGASFSIEPGEKLAIVGRNGCGKTSLLRILAGEDDDHRGTARLSKGCRTAYVTQKAPAYFEGETAADFICRDAFARRAELDILAEALQAPGAPGYSAAMARYAAAREAYDAERGDLAEETASRLLERAGLDARASVLASSLSGGEKNVLSILRAARSSPDLLLLDEPGNHLDLGGLAWLEEFIRALPCAALLVSHDRRLLDKAVDGVLELEGGTLTRYSGGYSAYRLEKLKRAAGQGQSWQADRKRVERLEALVRRFAEIARARPDPAWGKRLRARRSQLERVKAEAAERPGLGDREAKVSFSGEASKADIAIRVEGYSKRYGEVEVIADSSFEILTGERVALVGPNGSGKTSLVRDIAERGSWDDPTVKLGPSMVVGYCAQAQEVFDRELSVEQEFLKLLPTRRDAFAHLGRFLFSYADLDKLIGDLSGGELNRLQLARASALKANLLILDEPTNHLDIPTREAVEDALAEFEGTTLVVSHDRYFLEKIAGRVLFIEGGRVAAYEGSFAEYWRDVGAASAGAASAKAGALNASLESDAGEGAAPRNPRRNGGKAPRRGGIAELEARIDAMERERESLERRAAEAFDARDYAKAKDIASSLEKHNARLADAWSRLAAEEG